MLVTQTVYTIGHSNRTVDELVALLREVDVDLLVDVRAFPRSRSMPQFNIDTLPEALTAEGIGYQHIRALVPSMQVDCLQCVEPPTSFRLGSLGISQARN